MNSPSAMDVEKLEKHVEKLKKQADGASMKKRPAANIAFTEASSKLKKAKEEEEAKKAAEAEAVAKKAAEELAKQQQLTTNKAIASALRKTQQQKNEVTSCVLPTTGM